MIPQKLLNRLEVAEAALVKHHKWLEDQEHLQILELATEEELRSFIRIMEKYERAGKPEALTKEEQNAIGALWASWIERFNAGMTSPPETDDPGDEG